MEPEYGIEFLQTDLETGIQVELREGWIVLSQETTSEEADIIPDWPTRVSITFPVFRHENVKYLIDAAEDFYWNGGE